MKGAPGELTEGERNGDATTQRWRSGGGPVGRRKHEAEERGEGGDGVLGHTREGGREGKERGAAATGRPL
jgi:hypothetical protein